MKLRLLQNIVIGGVITAFGIFSFNTMTTLAQAPLDKEENVTPNRPSMPMNQNMGKMMKKCLAMHEAMQENMTENSQKMMN